MPRTPDKCRLLHAPYHAQPLRRGDRADPHLRGTVKITSWTDAPISWPRCRPLEGKSRPSLLLDDELARAVRTEAAAALCFWWGVSHGVVERWRKFLDVTRTNNPRTHELVKKAAREGAAALSGDWIAAKLLLTYAVGKAPEAVNADRLDLDQWKLLDAWPPLDQMIRALMDGIDPAAAVEFYNQGLRPLVRDRLREVLKDAPAALYGPGVVAERAAHVGK